MSLTKSALKIVYKASFEARNKWKNILLELEVSSATIKSIGNRCHDNPEDCYREGLLEWLEGGERNWGDLVEALSSPTVGHSEIAMVIERDYIQSTGVVRQIAETASNSHCQEINNRLTIFPDRNIGSGAFGVVFEGSYRSRPCAVKVLHELATQIRTKLPIGQENEEAIKSFDRECEFLESFQHPNIVQHLSTDEHPISGSTILVTELMDCNLRSYLSGLGEESLTSHCQLSLFKDVASGLAYIHSRQIIHRDLCGDNVLLKLHQPIPVAKISDFGMSRLLDPSQMSSTLTAVGHRMGYLPPEALRLENEEYDHSLDVFSLGVIMVQILHKVETVKTAKDRSFLVSQIPTTHRLKSIINDCLQEDRRRRPTAKDICTITEREVIVEKMNNLGWRDHVTQRRLPAPVKEANELDDSSQELKLHLSLKWRRGEDMPTKMAAEVQSVVIDKYVYVGGGSADSTSSKCTVMELDLQRDEWTKLPQYGFEFFAMMSLANQLVLVGGYDSATQKQTNQIAVYDNGKWCHQHPPMNTARSSSTASYFSSNLIVAGGWVEQGPTSSVEVLDLTLRKWYTAESLNHPQYELKSTAAGNTFYLMGGRDKNFYSTSVVQKVDLNELIAKAVSKQATPTLWQVIDTPLKRSTPLNVRGSLLAVGGCDDYGKSSATIYLYQPDTKSWVKVGDLPTARYDSTCSVLPSGEVIVAGGQTSYKIKGQYKSDHISTVDFLSISYTL